ncbi:hypothetical protein DSO57_1013064 [Entomophthora muscae]|uniref:Uncharacterized protein n=1 Tax=Entomophthora muscae TaxID=34485 RepID=A0ACC2TTL0_9FUNG|nr:hypothetical protein DSO57_1013064 [Entomophthora muscae]
MPVANPTKQSTADLINSSLIPQERHSEWNWSMPRLGNHLQHNLQHWKRRPASILRWIQVGQRCISLAGMVSFRVSKHQAPVPWCCLGK